MKISEKSLELNVGAELLGLLRGPWRMPKAYLRGLTQREESQEGRGLLCSIDAGDQDFRVSVQGTEGASRRGALQVHHSTPTA